MGAGRKSFRAQSVNNSTPAHAPTLAGRSESRFGQQLYFLPLELTAIAFIGSPESLFKNQLTDGQTGRELHSQSAMIADF